MRSLQHGMKLTPTDTHIAAVEDRKRERVLQKTSQRGFMVIAVCADDEHQIGDHTNRRLRAVDLGLYRKFVGGGTACRLRGTRAQQLKIERCLAIKKAICCPVRRTAISRPWSSVIPVT